MTVQDTEVDHYHLAVAEIVRTEAVIAGTSAWNTKLTRTDAEQQADRLFDTRADDLESIWLIACDPNCNTLMDTMCTLPDEWPGTPYWTAAPTGPST